VDYSFLGFFDLGVSGVFMVGGIATMFYSIYQHSRTFVTGQKRRD
jgi:ABC-type uncharacterized transport system permease subunit